MRSVLILLCIFAASGLPRVAEAQPTVTTWTVRDYAGLAYLEFSGMWPTGCPPSGNSAQVAQGQPIVVEILPPGVSCEFSFTPYSLTAYLGHLSPGAHHVSIVWRSDASSSAMVLANLTIQWPEGSTPLIASVPTRRPAGMATLIALLGGFGLWFGRRAQR